MRKALAAAAVTLLALVGCATTISGAASKDTGATVSTSAETTTTEPETTTSSTSRTTTSRTTTTSTTTSTTTTPVPSIPDGFDDWDGDLAYRGMSTEEFTCAEDQTSGCFGVEVFSAFGCPEGALVILDIYNEDVDPAEIIGQAEGTTPAIDVGGTQQVIISDATGYEGTASAGIYDISC